MFCRIRLTNPRTLTLSLALAIPLAGAIYGGLVDVLNSKAMDWRFSFTNRMPSGDVVLVDIDAKSLAEIGVWPWPRRLHGELVETADQLGAANIAFDIDFNTSSNPINDDHFAQAIAESSAAVFLASFVQLESADDNKVLLNTPIDKLASHSWPALVNVAPEAGGVVRRFPFALGFGDEALVSMATLLSGRTENTGSFEIDFTIEASRIPRVSYVDLVRGQVEPQMIKGKSLIVGATAVELHDLFTVPVYGTVSGSTVIAMATETLVQDRELALWVVPVAILPLILGLGILATGRLSSRPIFLAIGMFSTAIEAAALYLQAFQGLAIGTGSLHLALATLALWSVMRELDLRRVLLWIARTELANHETVLSRVLDDGFDGVLLLDSQGTIVKVNKHAFELLGRTRLMSAADLPPGLAAMLRPDASRAMACERLQLATSERIVEYNIARVQITDIRDADEALAGSRDLFCVAIRDVTERERATENMRFLALNDSLTSLPNRRALELELKAVLNDRRQRAEIALISFDLDRFKLVNDTLGHTVGDGVLRQVAQRAQKVLGADSFVARLGGDEFFAILPRSRCDSSAVALSTAIRQPFTVDGHTVSVGVSIGISHPDDSLDAEILIRHADLALYRAKLGGGLAYYDSILEKGRQMRLELERDLAEALEKGQFHVVFQPQVCLHSGRIIGAEALLRWLHPARGQISPQVFVPLAEEMGLIRRLGSWILREACREATSWPKPIKVAVNVSPIQFLNDELPDVVADALRSSGLEANRLELEITESVFVRDSDVLRNSFEKLLAMGVSFALDDFGTGYSSLGYLHRFPVSKVKIDQSFTRDLECSAAALAVMRAVKVLAAGLKIRTIAEGIETQTQAELLKELGYEEGQGYLYSKPAGSAEIVDLLNDALSLHPKISSAA